MLRALLIQMLYLVRSERMLMEQLQHNLLFRWFVGLELNEPVWHPTVFTKNRDRPAAGREVALEILRHKAAGRGTRGADRGPHRVGCMFNFAAAYNLFRMRKLSLQPANG